MNCRFSFPLLLVLLVVVSADPLRLVLAPESSELPPVLDEVSPPALLELVLVESLLPPVFAVLADVLLDLLVLVVLPPVTLELVLLPPVLTVLVELVLPPALMPRLVPLAELAPPVAVPPAPPVPPVAVFLVLLVLPLAFDLELELFLFPEVVLVGETVVVLSPPLVEADPPFAVPPAPPFADAVPPAPPAAELWLPLVVLPTVLSPPLVDAEPPAELDAPVVALPPVVVVVGVVVGVVLLPLLPLPLPPLVVVVVVLACAAVAAPRLSASTTATNVFKSYPFLSGGLFRLLEQTEYYTLLPKRQ